MLGRQCLHDQPAIKALGIESQMSFSGSQHIITCRQGIKHILCDSVQLLETCTQSLLLLVIFPFADFALHPFAVINLSCEF